jgi:hypothetical protein
VDITVASILYVGFVVIFYFYRHLYRLVDKCVRSFNLSSLALSIKMEFRGAGVAPPRSFNYVASLGRLHAALPDYLAALVDEIGLIPPPAPLLYMLVPPYGFTRDRYSTSLVHMHLGGEGVPFSAAEVTADGNCLFYSASLLITGKHSECLFIYVLCTVYIVYSVLCTVYCTLYTVHSTHDVKTSCVKQHDFTLNSMTSHVKQHDVMCSTT